ncbi:uncharacterized protein LOC130892240 [Diorhabda carinulata]|uniref:uncharacterized protein LOC130892240 n=1 Tax=Diorhabda carinulata TaxID=1163345 RepID=UPI0025A18DCC|nr:uncharacterized protein LOC130892240 [Diorhabda carinulata]
MVVEGEYYNGPCKLLELPHDVLNILFSYLDATSLYHLSRTCNYLKEFVLDPLFWKYIDARDEPNSLHKIEYCTQRLHKKTAHFFLRGNLTVSDLPVNFFKITKSFENIRILALENVKIRGSKVALRDFPSGLEELSLRRTFVTNSEYFFQHSVKNIPKLRVLILDECVWVTCSFLLSVSKYEHLEIISIVKCLRVHLNMIPYLSVAKLGCKNLKIFDCRFTAIGCELLRTFYSKENLQRLYFQSFKSAEFDYDENIFDYSGRKNSVPEPNSDFSIADIHLCEYMTTTAKPKNEVAKIQDSVLYRDPYPECECGGEGSKEPLNSSVVFPEVDIMRMPSGTDEQKFLCRKHMKNVTKLPSKVKAFFLSQQKFDPDIHSDRESTSDEEEDDNCCYFGMGNSLIVPTAHDRTPSVGEEMTLPEEGARNLHSPRGVVEQVADDLEDIRDCANSSPSTSRYGVRGSSLDYRNLKRPHKDNDEDMHDIGQIKKAKKNNNTPFDGLTNEAREALVNDLVKSIDDVNSRIQRIVRAGSSSIHTRNTQTRSQPECQPSTSRSVNGHPNNETSQPSSSSTITISHDFINRPSCSTIKINRNGNDASPKADESTGRNRIVREIREIRIFSRDDIPNNQDRWKVKWKIPLRRLSLRGYKNISDSTLSHLKNLDIELIDLTYTSVTKVGIDNFLVHNPNCRVIHPLYCVCKPKITLF